MKVSLELERERIRLKPEDIDSIFRLYRGAFYLILDQSHYESLIFLSALFRQLRNNSVYEIVLLSTQEVNLPFKLEVIDFDKLSLNDISIMVNKLRDSSSNRGIIIHHYLPSLLVKENEDSILRMLEFWRGRARDSGTIEFFTLPSSVYSVEKKLESMVDGTINIKVINSNKGEYNLLVKKACAPRYHMTEFSITINNSVVRIVRPKITEPKSNVAIREITESRASDIRYISAHYRFLRVKVTPQFFVAELPKGDRDLIMEINGKNLAEIRSMFPRVFNSTLLPKIAKWESEGVIKLERCQANVL